MEGVTEFLREGNIDDIINHRDLIPMDRYQLSWNPNITLEWMDRIDSLPEARRGWNWYYISRIISITEVIENPLERWNMEGLSRNKDITLDIIDQYMPNASGDIYWPGLSERVPISDVMEHPYLTWDKMGLSRNKDINISILKMNLPNATRRWLWTILTKNMPIEEIRHNPSLEWNKIELNPGYTADDIYL